MPEHPLNNSPIREGPDQSDVETHRSKDHFCMHPCNSRTHGRNRFENGLDNGVRSLSGRSFSWDPFISQIIPDANGVIPHTPFHGCIERERFNAKIPLVSVYNFTFFWEINLTVMEWGRCSLKFPDQTIVTIFFSEVPARKYRSSGVRFEYLSPQ